MKVYGVRGRLLQVDINEDFDRLGTLRMGSLDAYEPVRQNRFWSAHNGFDRREMMVWDHRDSPTSCATRPLTDADLSLCEFADPGFGEFNELWQRVETYLQNEGFGTLRDNFESWRA